MDQMLEKLNRIYPNCGYVKIEKYKEEQWKDKNYDSSFDNKAPMNKWKTNPLSYDDAQVWLEEGGRIGWIVPKGYCVIDVDNKDDVRSLYTLMKLLDKFEVRYNYNYTSRGGHLLFQDCNEMIKSDSCMKCGLNITIDTRANGTGYIILPCNDPHRKWGEWRDYVEELPYFLKPMLKDGTPSFIGMTEGDGRNNALFKWRSQLERCQKLSAQEIEKCIRIINENIFETPMPNNELFKTVLKERDKDSRPNAAEKENIYNTIADAIVGKYDFVSYYSDFYRFNGIYYKKITDLDLEKIIHFEASKNIGSTGRKEIKEFVKLKTQVPISEFNKDWHKIACKNGILNLVTGELEIPNKSDVNTIFIPYEYLSDPPYSPRIGQFMKELTGGDMIKMQFLYQIAGYCLLKKNIFEKFIICKGEGGTGKSTYTNLLQQLVGGDVNCSHVSLQDFDKDYYIANTVGKLLNVDDDVVDGKVLEGTGRFKSIISGNMVSCRQIYREVMDFIPYVTCVFSCNRLPKIMDKTTGLYRRMILIELNNKVKKPDPLFMNKVTEEDMQYFLFKAVEGIKLAIEEGHFRISQSESSLLEFFRRRQSPLNEWLYENGITLGDLHGKKYMPFFSQYKEWCILNGYNKLMSSFTFKEDICALYDIEIRMQRIEDSGMPVQIFFKPGDFDPDYKPF